MINRIKEKPACFGHIDDGCLWFEAFNGEKEDPYIYFGFKVVGDQAAMHIHFNRSIIGIFKQCRKDWNFLLKILRDMGAKSLLATNPEADETLFKLYRIFGFSEPKTMIYSTLEI